MSDALERCAWPLRSVDEAISALAGMKGMGPSPASGEVAPAGLDERDEAATSRWIERVAATLGVDAEPVEGTYAGLDALLRACGPALLRLPGTGARFLAVLEARGRRVRLVDPARRKRWVPLAAVRATLAQELERSAASPLQTVLERARLEGAARARAQEALIHQRLGSEPIAGIWLVRLPPGSSFARQLAVTGVLHRASLLVASHVAHYGLFLGSWWLLGAGLLEGRLDPGYLAAWALLLVSAIPFQLSTSWLSGTVAYDTGALLKRRLLGGALRLEPEELREQGIGQLLGRVLESESVEALALSSGLVGAIALVELAFACAILAAGASRPGLAGMLVAFIALSAVLGVRSARAQRDWSGARLGLTHELIEAMVGHRTRLAQEKRERWHEREDPALERYLARSRLLDGRQAVLQSVPARGWMACAVAWLGVSLLDGSEGVGALAAGLGGALLAHQGLQKLVEGLAGLAAAGVSWRQVRPLFAAAARPEQQGMPAATVTPGADGAGPRLFEARDVWFRYPQRRRVVLQGVSLHVDRGDRVLLGGGSGSGKSTLVALLSGLRAPDSGLLLFGGLDRESLGERTWRARIAAAPQFHENHIFAHSLAFNLLMGRRWPPTEEDLEEAAALCHQLGLGPLLQRMPARLNQVLGETGWQLSHGERSRVFIARALLQDAEVVILDESFGALDPETLEQALRCVLTRARTLLVISHP